jgi:TP901 family phage tail tape measure protein
MTLAAADKMSAVIDRIALKFPNLTRQIKRSGTEMALYERRTAALTKKLNSIGQKTKDVGAKMSIGLTAPMAAFGYSAFRSSVDFEKGMNKVEALTGATGKTLGEMRSQAKKLGIETQFSAGQAADAMGFLGMAGWTTEQIMKGIPGVLDLAAASGIDLARAADISSNIMGAFKMDANDASKAADILARTTSSSNVDMEMLAETMKYAAPVANKFGASLSDTAALAGLLGNVGIQGSNAGTAIKNAMLGLAAPAGGARKLLEAMGVQVSNANGEIRPFASIIQEMGDGLKKLPKADQLAVMREVFGKLSLAGASELVDSISEVGKSGKTNFQTLSERINDTSKTAKSMAETMNKGAPGAIKSFASALEGLQIAFMESGALQVITDIALKATDLMRSLANNSGLVKFLAIMGTVAAVIGPVVYAMGVISTSLSSVIGLIGVVGPLFTGLAGVIGSVAGAISLPILAIGAAISGVIFLIYKFRNEIAGGFSRAIEKIKGVFGFGSPGGRGEALSSPSQDLPRIQQNLIEKKETSESKLSILMPSGVKTKQEGPMTGISFSTGNMGMSF